MDTPQLIRRLNILRSHLRDLRCAQDQALHGCMREDPFTDQVAFCQACQDFCTCLVRIIVANHLFEEASTALVDNMVPPLEDDAVKASQGYSLSSARLRWPELVTSPRWLELVATELRAMGLEPLR